MTWSVLSCRFVLSPWFYALEWRPIFSQVADLSLHYYVELDSSKVVFCEFYKILKERPVLTDHVSYSWYMARFFNSEDFCWGILPAQKKEKILPVTVEESCQPLLKNRSGDCWRIMPVTVEESCQPLLNNHASNCWTIVPVTVEKSFQRLFINLAIDCCP